MQALVDFKNTYDLNSKYPGGKWELNSSRFLFLVGIFTTDHRKPNIKLKIILQK